MTRPTFTVVTPTYNDLTELKRCVGSVRGQHGVSIQHIIQDGASTDGTDTWIYGQKDLDAYVEQDDGLYQAINNGWQKSSGDLLCWLNSDEQYLPGALATVAAVFREHPEIDFVRGNYIVVDANGEPIAARRDVRLSKLYISNTFLNTSTCALFFRRRLWDEGILRLDEAYHYAADMDLILRLIKDGRRCHYIDSYLSLFMFDGANLSCHDEMPEEIATLQRKHGGSRYALHRNLVRCARNLERLVSGSYRRSALAYDFAVDDVPTYRHVTAPAVPFFYRTRRISGQSRFK